MWRHALPNTPRDQRARRGEPMNMVREAWNRINRFDTFVLGWGVGTATGSIIVAVVALTQCLGAP